MQQSIVDQAGLCGSQHAFLVAGFQLGHGHFDPEGIQTGRLRDFLRRDPDF
jgi:hypothetical protein